MSLFINLISNLALRPSRGVVRGEVPPPPGLADQGSRGAGKTARKVRQSRHDSPNMKHTAKIFYIYFFPRVFLVAVCALAAAAFADYFFYRREACRFRNGPLFCFAHILPVAALDAVVVDFHAVLYVS